MKFQKQTYTQIPNSLFTEMKDMDECELKVVMLICRYTFGYHREEVKLSTRRIADEIGMNTASVQKGADAAVERGLIEKVIDGNKTTTWRAVVDDSNSDTPAIQILTRGDSNSESQSSIKESIKKEKKLKATATPPEVKLFREVKGRYPSKDVYDVVVEKIQAVNKRLLRPATKDDLNPFWKSWRSKGYSPENLAWLDWAISGQVPLNAKIANIQEPKSYNGIREFLSGN
jgi:hypothetical protein